MSMCCIFKYLIEKMQLDCNEIWPEDQTIEVKIKNKFEGHV